MIRLCFPGKGGKRLSKIQVFNAGKIAQYCFFSGFKTFPFVSKRRVLIAILL